MAELIPTEADEAVRECLETRRNFSVIAGAGSGKTTSLIAALENIRTIHGAELRKNGQRIACITYTKRAVEVIKTKLEFDDLYVVSTLHSFLWGELGRFTDDIRKALRDHRIPMLLTKAREKDTGKETKEARKAREQISHLEEQLGGLEDVREFNYDDSTFSDYLSGRINHDDVIEVAGYLMAERPVFRKLLGLRFPYIFVDEAQDTFECIVAGLNLTCSQEGLPLVGYFGDPWQQIYEDRAGEITLPTNGRMITKTENFRCSSKVIDFLNAFRRDVQQYPAGDNKDRVGSVEVMLVQSEEPEEPRKRYSEQQIERALMHMDSAIKKWGLEDREDVVRLFLVRQMIARRLGFSSLNQLFTGPYASTRAQDDYETGKHFLLKPFIETIHPLVTAYRNSDTRNAIDILRRDSPYFDIRGPNRVRPLSEMIAISDEALKGLTQEWDEGSIRSVLEFCQHRELIQMPERLTEQLARNRRDEDFNPDLHQTEKGDWLCDEFFAMPTKELEAYSKFILKNTAYSTQHGVKGEEYPNVVVVFDDVEAAWSHYSFTKLLTPQTAGAPTEGQQDRGRKLAYVCFSRAEDSLRVLLFTPNPAAAKRELVERKLLSEEQISVLD